MKVYSHFFRKILLKKYLYVIPLIISSYLTGQTITVGGSNWTVSVPSITEAGTNYAGTYQSATNLITLSGTLPGYSYYLEQQSTPLCQKKWRDN